ncbi:sialidase family protein [Paludisphaera rhizosphaerae]|uniref:sialidase family protein n=1 Tax=Paludisphaera rhizosphaerae TaxID=2711216 RepID=UPI0013EE0985|nr:sialidase family protein [Paludisphaera rhizosphaerae]
MLARIVRPGLALVWSILILIVAAGFAPPVVSWEPETLRLVQEGADYARMARLGDGRVGCAYDRGGRLYFRRSADDGATWEAPVLVNEDPECWLTNAEILPTRSGPLLYFWNERPRKAVRMQRERAAKAELTRPFLIRMARSDDHGRTWSPPRTLYEGGTTFQDGCWEPAPVELPSGEIQVYFANERPFPTTNEQEIDVLRSVDGGSTWSPAEAFAFRRGRRDGMPVPALLADGRRVAVAIEDDGLSGDRFKPSIILREPGRDGVVGGDDSRRWGALAEPLNPSWYAGAPYLRRLGDGSTAISFQEDRSGAMRDCRLVVCTGDADARGFTNRSYPFPDEAGSKQLWGSLFVKDDHTITAVVTGAFRGVRGVWAVDGRISPAAVPNR